MSECNLRCGVQWAACTTGGDLKNSLIAVVQLESCFVGFFFFLLGRGVGSEFL